MENYEIRHKLGSGNFAKVYFAVHTVTGREVALKLVNKKGLKNVSLRRFYAEMANMKTLTGHKNIISLFDTFETEKYFVIAMEYAPGGELFDFVQKQEGMDESSARTMFRHIIHGVQHCHRNGISHRDLKLENILLDDQLIPKIADFGFSKHVTPVALTASRVGSPLYSSPEIIMGKPYKGPECDVWSLGVILYTMLTASMPFDDSHMGQFLVRVENGDYPQPLGVSQAAKDLISKMLNPDSSNRYTIQDILAHSWVTGSQKASSPVSKPSVRRYGVCYEDAEYIRNALVKLNECNCSCHMSEYANGHRDSVISKHCNDCDDVLANDPEIMLRRQIKLSRNSSLSSGYGSELGSQYFQPFNNSQLNIPGLSSTSYRRSSVPRKSSTSVICNRTISKENQHRCSVPCKITTALGDCDDDGDIVFV